MREVAGRTVQTASVYGTLMNNVDFVNIRWDFAT